GKTVFELPRRDEGLHLQRQDEAVLASGEPQLYSIEQRTGPNGEEWDLISRLPLKDANGQMVGVIAILRNITEQKQAESKIQESVRRRDQFLAMLSHELRNPLGAISTALALIEVEGGAPAPRLMEVLKRQTEQMGRLLDDLLEVSRVTENKIELRKRVVDLRQVIAEAVESVRPLMSARNLRFDVDTDSSPLFVEGDATRLQQIQINLLSNAAKYTEPGGHVALRAVREGDEVVIRVRDDGMGIAPEMQESVFELFVQSSRTLDRSAGGLGVGLTLARSLVALHGGNIHVHSDGEGKGSEFVVRLPATAAPDSDGVRSARGAKALAGGARILLVEDNDDSRELMCALLERSGFVCNTAATGTAALELVRSWCPDIAILDVGLPEMDGYELAQRIRKDASCSQTILIAVTGYGRASDHEASRAAGFDGHLVKPVNIEQLLSLLASFREGAPSLRARLLAPVAEPA
ncbi:MAG: ATP-binding protein, partial [Polyangiaceae bacterium]